MKLNDADTRRRLLLFSECRVRCEKTYRTKREYLSAHYTARIADPSSSYLEARQTAGNCTHICDWGFASDFFLFFVMLPVIALILTHNCGSCSSHGPGLQHKSEIRDYRNAVRTRVKSNAFQYNSLSNCNSSKYNSDDAFRIWFAKLNRFKEICIEINSHRWNVFSEFLGAKFHSKK